MSGAPARLAFDFRSAFQGRAHFTVYGDGAAYRVELRPDHTLGRYDGRPLAQAVLDAFNAWRASEYAEHARRWADRYPDMLPPAPPPATLRPAEVPE